MQGATGASDAVRTSALGDPEGCKTAGGGRGRAFKSAAVPVDESVPGHVATSSQQ